MKKWRWLLLVFVLIGHGNAQYQENEGTAIIIPPDFKTFAPPASVGGSYIDPAFGTRITRVSNCTTAGQDAVGGYFANSEFCCFNIDGSYFMASEDVIIDGQRKIYSFLYDGRTGEKIRRLESGTFQTWWMRWALADRYRANDRTITFDPRYCFYKFEGNEMRLYDVRDFPNYTLLHRFSEYSMIGPAGGEGDISDDGRYWCLDGDGRELFVYDLVDDIKYPASTFDSSTMSLLDYAAVSADGQFVIVSWHSEPALDRLHGIELYDREWNFQRQLYPGLIHWEVGVDAFGHQVMYTVAGFDMPEFYSRYGVRSGDVISIRLSDGYIRLLKEMNPWASQVMSACNSVTDPTTLYVSFYGRSYDPEKSWAPLWGEIVGIATDGSQTVNRVLHHRTRPVPGKPEKYWQPDMVVNRQGTAAIFRSAFLSPIPDLYFFRISDDVSDADTTPPLMPQEFRSPEQGFNDIKLTWRPPYPATDNGTADFYRLYRDGQEIARVYSTLYQDTQLTEDQQYRYELYSVDNAGLQSLEPARLTVSTLGDTLPPTIVDCSFIDAGQLRLRFSEAIDSVAAARHEAYRLSPYRTLYDVQVGQACQSVDLWLDPLDPGIVYQLQVDGLTDQSKRKNPLHLDSALSLQLQLYFSDSFSDSNLRSWRLNRPERWAVEEAGTLLLAEENYESPAGKRLGEYALLDPGVSFPLRVRFGCQAQSIENPATNPYCDYALLFNYSDSLNYDYVQIHSYDVQAVAIREGETVKNSKVANDLSLSEWNRIELVLEPDLLQVQINQEVVLLEAWPVKASGLLGLGSFNDRVRFDGVTVQALDSSDTIPPAAPLGLEIEQVP